jgi:hypothetical protein
MRLDCPLSAAAAEMQGKRTSSQRPRAPPHTRTARRTSRRKRSTTHPRVYVCTRAKATAHQVVCVRVRRE